MSILDPQTMDTPVATNQMIGLYAQDSVLGTSKDSIWPILIGQPSPVRITNF